MPCMAVTPPDAQSVRGFPPGEVPGYANRLRSEQVHRLVSYVASLR